MKLKRWWDTAVDARTEMQRTRISLHFKENIHNGSNISTQW